MENKLSIPRSNRLLNTLNSEKKYRDKLWVKEYRKEYCRIYRMFSQDIISLDEFNALKPSSKEYKLKYQDSLKIDFK